jgi:hypothetical protein
LAYVKTIWSTGDTITATLANHFEQGIADAHTTADAAETPAGAQTKANTAESNAKNASVPRVGDNTLALKVGGAGYDGNGAFIAFPKGGSIKTNANQTGALKITLPQLWTNTMMRFAIDVYEYSTNKSFTIYVGGYNYATNSDWINTFAYTVGGKSVPDYTVRFGHDGFKACIWVGETGTTWNYPQAVIRDFYAGFSSDSFANWADGWNLSFVTAFGTIQDTHSGNLVDARNAELLNGYSSSSASGANTITKRDGSGDITARLFRSEWDTTNANIGFIMSQVNTGADNYLRPSTPAQVRAGLGTLMTRESNGALEYSTDNGGTWKPVGRMANTVKTANLQQSASANTWYTVLDLLGAGVLFRASNFGSGTYGSSFCQSRITIDGVAHTETVAGSSRSLGDDGGLDILQHTQFDSSLKVEILYSQSSHTIYGAVDYGLF